jgi:hypothetical protein
MTVSSPGWSNVPIASYFRRGFSVNEKAQARGMRPRASSQVFGDKEQYHDNPGCTCGRPEIAHLDHPMTHPEQEIEYA